jgi:hypothetical protein
MMTTEHAQHFIQESFYLPTGAQDQYLDLSQLQETPFLTTSPEKRVTLWNSVERRKISGNAAPMSKNLAVYLEKHPMCEIYTGQDKVYVPPSKQMPPPQEEPVQYFHAFSASTFGGGLRNNSQGKLEIVLDIPREYFKEIPGERRVTMWQKTERRKISGNAAPMEKNVIAYLSTHPECEIYDGQDKEETTNVVQPAEEQKPEDPQQQRPISQDTYGVPLHPISQFGCLDQYMFSSPMFVPRSQLVCPMSPVMSLASSLGGMDFYLTPEDDFEDDSDLQDHSEDANIEMVSDPLESTTCGSLITMNWPGGR